MPLAADRRYSFGGGLNSQENPATIQDDELSDVRNFNYDITGALITRGGQARISTVPGDANKVTSLYKYYRTSGSDIVFFRNQTMYKRASTDGTSIDATAYTAHSTFSFVTFNNILYWTNGTDTVASETIRRWNGTTAAAPADSPAELCKYLAHSTAASRIFAAGGVTNSQRLYFSALGDPEDWTTANDAGFIDVPQTGSGITGIVEIGAGLLIFTRSSIHILSGSDPSNFNLREISPNVGCTAPRSLAASGKRALFLCQNIVYECDGTNVYPASSRVTPTIDTMTALTSAIGFVYKDQYWLALTASGGSTNNRVLVYYFNQPAKGNRRPWTLYNSINIASATTLDGDAGELYTGDYAGYVNQQDSGTTDFGTGITSYADTGWQFLGEPDRFKKFKRVWVLVEPTGAYNLSVYPSFDGLINTTVPELISLTPASAVWGSVDWDEFDWAGTSTFITDEIVTADRARSMLLRFQATSPVKIYGYSIMNRRKHLR